MQFGITLRTSALPQPLHCISPGAGDGEVILEEARDGVITSRHKTKDAACWGYECLCVHPSVLPPNASTSSSPVSFVWRTSTFHGNDSSDYKKIDVSQLVGAGDGDVIIEESDSFLQLCKPKSYGETTLPSVFKQG